MSFTTIMLVWVPLWIAVIMAALVWWTGRSGYSDDDTGEFKDWL